MHDPDHVHYSNDSKIMRNLNNYNIIPDEKTKRKLDYYYGPYYPGNNNLKYMDFRIPDDSVETQERLVFKKTSRPKPVIKVKPKIPSNKIYYLPKKAETVPVDPK